MTRVLVPCSALSSRTARMRRTAGSPRLTTAIRRNTRAPLPCGRSYARGHWLRLHVQAAVDAPDLSSDVGRGVRGEEVDDAGDLLGLAEPPERDLRPEGVQDLVRDAAQHLRRGVARGHGVDGDPEPVGLAGPLDLHRGLPGEGLGQ